MEYSAREMRECEGQIETYRYSFFTLKQTECVKLKSNVKKYDTYIIGHIFSWRMCNWSLKVKFWGKKVPRFKNLFSISLEIRSFGYMEMGMTNLGLLQIQIYRDLLTAHEDGIFPGCNPASKHLGCNRIFPKRVLYKAVSSGAHQNTPISLGIRNSLSSWREHCSLSCFGKHLFLCEKP